MANRLIGPPKASQVRDYLTLADWLCFCRDGRIPPAAAKIIMAGGWKAEVVEVLRLLGGLRPIQTIWPAGPVTYFEYETDVAIATSADDPAEKKLLELCAPIDRSIWVQTLRVTAANTTAEDFGEVSTKNNKFVDFPEMCLPSHPQSGLGRFQNIENFGLVPEAGFRVYGLNYSTSSVARFHVVLRAWPMD